MRYTTAFLTACVVIGGMAWRASGEIFAQTGFNDQSGINSNATPGNPYTINQTVDGVSNSEPGWTGPWVALNGGALGGGAFAIVKTTSAFEGDAGLSIIPGSFGSTQVYRDFGARTDRFVVETEVNFGSVGDFEGLVIQDNYPLSANRNGPQWRLTGAVGSRHFEVFNGTSNGGGAWLNTGIVQTPGQWQGVVADINVVTQQWFFSVDGVPFNQALGFQNAPPFLNALYYSSSASGSVDSIIVRAVPEPAALATLGAGALLALIRRQRRTPLRLHRKDEEKGSNI